VDSQFISRPFSVDDSQSIIHLYKVLTGRQRTKIEYDWEWINTWNGMGSSWVMIDAKRPKNKDIVCQYSLIPTPLSYYGDTVLCGKTENCMSHPDLRGKRVYFPHEKKYFEIAKRTYKAFFTTTGKGAPGRVRTKLGYYALDIWTRYYFFHSLSDSIKYQLENAKADVQKMGKLKSYLYYLLKGIYGFISFLKMSVSKSKPSKLFSTLSFDAENAPLKEIEEFWKRNSKYYDISIDRTRKYLDWRINKNPYHEYQYLLLKKNNRFVGYCIFTIDDRHLLNILDLVTERRQMDYFVELKNHLIAHSRDLKLKGVICKTVFNNLTLKDTFKGFGSKRKISKDWIKKQAKKGKEVHDFFGFVSDDIDRNNKCSDPQNWYITGLFLET